MWRGPAPGAAAMVRSGSAETHAVDDRMPGDAVGAEIDKKEMLPVRARQRAMAMRRLLAISPGAASPGAE